MKDYEITADNGNSVMVSAAPLGLIQSILAGDLEIYDPGDAGTVENAMERLRIELVARSLGA